MRKDDGTRDDALQRTAGAAIVKEPPRPAEMLGKLLEGQDKLGARIGQLDEKTAALRKDVAALRESLPR